MRNDERRNEENRIRTTRIAQETPCKFLPFMSTKFFNNFFPIHYLNVLAIIEILQNCFTYHIYP